MEYWLLTILRRQIKKYYNYEVGDMKIGIITFHFVYNCGAALQCFALQTELEKLGHEVCIINYRPWYHQNRYTPLKNPIYFAGKRFREPARNIGTRCWHAMDGFIRTVHSWKRYPEIAPRDKKFKKFTSSYLKETPVYRSLKQLQECPPDCQLYITGSDQLWNRALLGNAFDSAYFLNFGPKGVRRISYSVGADFSNIKDPVHELETLVKPLDVISLRESKWLSCVDKAAKGAIPIHLDLDPTLLLKAEDYMQHMADLPPEKEPYILVYSMPGETQKQIYNGARILSETLGIHTIDVSGNPGQMNKKIKDNRICGPDEFLWYVYHAEYVLTNSFHGTVFSIIFQKKFAVIPHAVTGNRVTELLDKLGLASRYYKLTQDAVKGILQNIDYAMVNKKLDQLRNDSIHFLQNCTDESNNF